MPPRHTVDDIAPRHKIAAALLERNDEFFALAGNGVPRAVKSWSPLRVRLSPVLAAGRSPSQKRDYGTATTTVDKVVPASFKTYL
jgi:hypothetical protein